MAALSAAATLGISATGGALATPAFAYPPDTKSMTIHADQTGRNTIEVTVGNGRPGCAVKVSANGSHPVRATLNGDGEAVVNLTVLATKRSAPVRVTAQTQRCKGPQQRASTTVTLSPGKVHCDEHAQHGRRFDVSLADWKPNRRVVVVVTDGRHRYNLSGWADRKGHVAVHFTPTWRGTWAVIALQDGRSSSVRVHVH
jgi:hypothetical protein